MSQSPESGRTESEGRKKSQRVQKLRGQKKPRPEKGGEKKKKRLRRGDYKGKKKENGITEINNFRRNPNEEDPLPKGEA